VFSKPGLQVNPPNKSDYFINLAMLLSSKPMKIDFLSLFIGALILCVPALLNHFPFIYSDSGTYLGIGFSDGISYVRPLLYGVFLRHVSLKDSLWLVIFFQALIIVSYIRLFLVHFFPGLPRFYLLGILALLTTCTSVGITTGMLMPDFTTPILFLAPALWLYASKMHWMSRALAFLGLWFTLANHHSHAYILLLILLSFIFLKIFFARLFRTLAWWRLIVLGGILVIGYLTIPTAHYLKKGKFIASKSRNIFLVSRIHQMGLLTEFLDEHCEETSYSLCKYKDNIPRSFLWGPGSPLKKDGGWEANNSAYAPLVSDFFLHSKYFRWFTIKATETSVQQFFTFNTVLLSPFSRNEWPQSVFQRHVPKMIPAFERSLQNRKEWSNIWLDQRQSLLVFGSMLGLLWFFFYQKRYSVNSTHQQLGLLLILLLLANAIICSSVSMLDARFQSRIIWLIPFFAITIAWNISRRSLMKSGNNEKRK